MSTPAEQLPVPAPPPPAAPQVTPSTGDIDARIAQEMRQSDERAAEISKAEKGVSDRFDPVQTAAEKDLLAAEKDQARFAEKELPQTPVLPERPPASFISPQDFQGYAWGLLAMAVVGGAASRGNWLGVSASLNGALEGIIQGDKQKAQTAYAKYRDDYDAATKHFDEEMKRYQSVLDSKKLTINEKLHEIEFLAAQRNREELRIAAQQRSFDQIQNRIDRLLMMRDNLKDRDARTNAQLQGALDRVLKSRQGLTPLTEDASRVAQVMDEVSGQPGYLTSRLYGRFSRDTAIPQFNALVANEKKDHPDWTNEQIGAVLAQNHAKIKAIESTYRQTQQREAGVLRLTDSIKSMQSQIIDLAKKVVPTGSPPANATINQIRIALGDGAIIQLRNMIMATARQYIEAVTMPGSNAQLHASSAEVADEMINANYSIEQIMGAFQGMNAEIDATQGALSGISKRLIERIGSQYGVQDLMPDIASRAGLKPIRGAESTSTGQFADPALEAEYQQWLKSQQH